MTSRGKVDWERSNLSVLHQSDTSVVLHGDCREVLPVLGRESIDAVVTDPPYGVEWSSGRRAERFDVMDGDRANDTEALLREAVGDLVRVTRRRRHIYTFGRPLPAHDLLATRADLVWRKSEGPGPGDLSLPFGPQHEPIHFHVRAPDRANAAGGRQVAALRRGTILDYPRLNAKQVRRHPTEKPVPLLRELIEASTTPGELILDPFGGVGSTGVAAVLSARRCIVVEINEEYATIAATRMGEAERIAALAHFV